MPQAQQAAVLQRVADALMIDVSQLHPAWASLVAQSTRDAAADLTSILALKGFSGSQILAADQFAVWQERLAAYFALGRGTALSSYDLKSVEWLDPRKMLQDAAALLISGEPVAPGESAVGGIGSGAVSAVEDARDRFDAL